MNATDNDRESHIAFNLDPRGAQRVGVGALPDDELRCAGERDRRDGLVQHVPETGDARGRPPAADQHADIAAGQPFGIERFIGPRLRVPGSEVPVELVQRRRPKAVIDGSPHGDAALADPIRP